MQFDQPMDLIEKRGHTLNLVDHDKGIRLARQERFQPAGRREKELV